MGTRHPLVPCATSRPPRAARELLTESRDRCFVQIGDENVHLVRSLMDEVFGSENFVSQICFRED